jgi:hypothetical protein
MINRRRLLPIGFVAACTALLPIFLCAERVCQTGTLVSVEKRVESTPRTYVWDVVVTSTDVITYRLYIQVANRTYVSDYTPEIQPSELPAGWRLGNRLDICVDKHRLMVKTSYGEIATYIRSHN